LLEVATLLFFPRQQYFTGTRSGLLSVFIPGEPFVEDKQPFPASWRDLFTDHYDFAKGERYTPDLTTLATAGPPPDSLTPILERATHDASDVEQLVRWLVERYNVLAFHQTEPAEFLDGDLVDFVTCFEHALTLDRSLRKGMSCVVSAESVIRKESAMEIADIIGELGSYWAGKKDGSERFKKLVHPVHGLALLKAALRTAPAPFDTILLDIAADIYDNLRATIIGSVFVPAKKNASGILVRNKDLSKENLESFDDFTANVTRALRNTHHGYLTNNDPSLRPSRYLALVNGSLPEAFARLGSLLALAATVDPETMFGWKFMPVGAFE